MSMKKILKNKKGFTLMEMLIVVAIIVILVAISIPTFTGQLNKAKAATDEANERSAKAVAAAAYLTEDKAEGDYYYDLSDGTIKLKSSNPSIKGYGKVSAKKDQIIQASITSGGSVSISWVPETDTTP